MNNIEIEFESDTDNESNMSEEDMDHIVEEELEFLDSTKEGGKYYLGLCKHFHSQNCFIMAISITPKMFLKTNYETALEYLYSYSIMHIHQPVIDIMKLEILDDETYAVVKKTHWIRLIQRTWKRVMKERDAILMRRFWNSYKELQLTGKYRKDAPKVQGLRGLMANYAPTCQR